MKINFKNSFHSIKKLIRIFLRNIFCLLKLWVVVGRIRRFKPICYVRHQYWLKKIFINKQNKLVLPSINYFISYQCNLKCEYCSYFNPFRNGILPKNSLIDSFQIWAERLQPENVVLGGGEPLLNPDYEEIALSASKIWKDSKIIIITNGILLSKVSDKFLRTIAGQKIEFRISRHLNTDNYNTNIKNAIKRFKKYGIVYEIVESFDAWSALYEINENGIPYPSNSDPKKAWNECFSKYCTCIIGRNLYRCSIQANVKLAIQEGILASNWSQASEHQGISVDHPVEKILSYLREGVMPACTICPEKIASVTAQQISPEKLKRIHLQIAEMNKTNIKKVS
jgi:organic radical activating enzyme